MIFVFGSNLAGIHGAGAARTAMKLHGAKYGVGVGLVGYSYAIPTKDQNIQSMNLEDIEPYVTEFISFAKSNPNLEFMVTQIGCGLAGFTAEQIAPLFKRPPSNCYFDSAWRGLVDSNQFWGTH
jgi:hypothetical protein